MNKPEKVILTFLIQSIITFFIAFLTSSYNTPTDETDVTINTGQQIFDVINKTSDNPTVQGVASDFKSILQMLETGVMVVSVIEFVICLCVLLYKLSDEPLQY